MLLSREPGGVEAKGKEGRLLEPVSLPLTTVFLEARYSLKTKTRFWPEKRTSFTWPVSLSSTAS